MPPADGPVREYHWDEVIAWVLREPGGATALSAVTLVRRSRISHRNGTRRQSQVAHDSRKWSGPRMGPRIARMRRVRDQPTRPVRVGEVTGENIQEGWSREHLLLQSVGQFPLDLDYLD